MFGADYPLFTYERLDSDWRARATPTRCSSKLLHRNAERLFEELEMHMNLDLTGKVAIVGGASQGIGYGIARTLAAEGARSRWRRAASRLCARPRERIRDETGAEVLPVQPTSARPRIASASSKPSSASFGRIDILVNNDGAPPLGEFLRFDDAAWDKAMEQNFMCVVRLTRGVVPHMQTRGGGRILNITAISAIQPMREVRPLGRDLGGRHRLREDAVAGGGADGINVNTICPGYINTTRLEKVFSSGAMSAQQMREELEREVPLGRIGTVADVASLVALLVSPRGSYVTGTVIPVDGGLLRAVR